MLTKLRAIAAWLQLVPIIIGAIRAIEDVMPESGLGSAKLTAIRLAIEAGYESVQDVLGAFGDVWPRIEALVKSLVEKFNEIGLFKRSG